MSDISTGMKVTGLSQWKSAFSQAQTSVKTLDAELKKAEAQYKATGDKEQYLADKSKTLQKQLEAQKKAAKTAEDALKQMDKQGVDKASKNYQEFQRKLLESQTAIINTSAEIENLGKSEIEAAAGADKLTASVNGIGKKMSLGQVISGIDSITNGLETAAKKAADVGKLIWDNIVDSARYADDTATSASVLGMDVEQYQAYRNVFSTEAELTVQEWQKAKLKVQKAINDPTQEQTDILGILGISTHEIQAGKYGVVQGAARNFEDVFWEIGRTLREKVASGEMTQDMADLYANSLFGRGFSGLNPIFAMGQEAFQEAVDDQVTASKKAIENNAKFNDALTDLQNDFESLKQEVLGGLTPALTKATEVLDGLLEKLITYLQTPEGQKALDDMGKAVEGLFSDLSKIDPEEVVEGFAGVFNGIVGGLQWLSTNSETVIGAMKTILIGWSTLTLTGGALKLYELIQGITGLATGGAASGAAAGSAWGGAFASAVLKAAPWLVGLITLLNPAGTQDNSLTVKDGNITQEGYYEFARQAMEDPGYKGFLMELGTYFGSQGLAQLMGNGQAVSDIWNYLIGGKQGYNTLGFVNEVLGKYTGQTFGTDWLGVEFSEEELNAVLQSMDLTLTPKIVFPEDVAKTISEEIGVVPVAVSPVFHRDRRTMNWTGFSPDGENANGIWSVPFDGYMSVLHKGERVVPAREVSSRNFSSNLYVENMNMNNGQDAAGLAAAIAAANRRTMSGYGS